MNTQYLVWEENTLCYTIGNTSILGVLASNINGRDPKNGGFIPVSSDKLRDATKEDFKTFRVTLPPDFQ